MMARRVEREELVQELIQIIPCVDLFLHYHLHHRLAEILVRLSRIDGHRHTLSNDPAVVVAGSLLSSWLPLPGMVCPAFVEDERRLEVEGIGGERRRVPGVSGGGGGSGSGGGGGKSGGRGGRGGCGGGLWL